MKNRLIIILVFLLASTVMYGQQMPLTESYFVNRYELSPSYAGNSENGYLFASYLQYWNGVNGSPQTLRLSYHNAVKSKKIGLGGNIMMDKSGIFRTFYGMATYSYRLKISTKDKILFGLSAGLIKNSIDFSAFANDPNFNSDPAVIQKDVNSKAKFISDLSAVYVHGNFQAGVLLSNISFGDYSYKEASVHYNPFLNYQFHAFYTVPFAKKWDLTSMAIYRGGNLFRNQFEIGAQVKYSNKFWGDIDFRSENIFGVGLGLAVSKSIVVNYNYNFPSGVDFNALQIHEFTLGVKL